MITTMIKHTVFSCIFLYANVALAVFGVTSSGGKYVVDAGSSNSLVIQVSSPLHSRPVLYSCLTMRQVNQANCDITSLVYRGTEYQYQSTFSHISSGLGSATVSATTINSKLLQLDLAVSTYNVGHYRPVCKGHLRNIYTYPLLRGKVWR